MQDDKLLSFRVYIIYIIYEHIWIYILCNQMFRLLFPSVAEKIVSIVNVRSPDKIFFIIIFFLL